MKYSTVAALLLALLLLAACAPPAGQLLSTEAPTSQLGPTEATEAVSATAPALLPSATTAPTSVPAGATAAATATREVTMEPNLLGLSQVEQARADLAARLAVSASAIQVISVEPVTWPNGALGCPQPGMAYADVLVDGLQIQLAHNGQAYNYHSGGTSAPFLCEQSAEAIKSTPLGGGLFDTPPAPDN